MEIKGLNFFKIKSSEIENPNLNKKSPLSQRSNDFGEMSLKKSSQLSRTPDEKVISSLSQEIQHLNTLLEKINEHLTSLNKVLKIEIDEDLKIPIFKIIDLISKEVLKQIPLEDILEFKKALAEFLKNLENEGIRPELLKGLFLQREA